MGPEGRRWEGSCGRLRRRCQESGRGVGGWSAGCWRGGAGSSGGGAAVDVGVWGIRWRDGRYRWRAGGGGRTGRGYGSCPGGSEAMHAGGLAGGLVVASCGRAAQVTVCHGSAGVSVKPSIPY